MVIVNGKDFGVDLIVLDLVDFDASREWIGWLLVMPPLTAIKKWCNSPCRVKHLLNLEVMLVPPRPN